MAMRHTLQGQYAISGEAPERLWHRAMPKRPQTEEAAAASELADAVGARLRLLLKVCGWDQSQVARLLSVDQSTVNKWVSGKRLQPVYHLITLCEQSGCTLDFLYRGKLGGLMRDDLQIHLAAASPDLAEGTPLEAAGRLAPGRRAKAKAPAP